MSYAISGGHIETINAAKEVLNAGGNAVDAAIAAFAASWVAEPCMSSPGGGGFANVFIPNKGCQIYDFFCQTPYRKRPVEEVDFFPIEVNFGDVTEAFHVGRGSIGVPGSVAGMFLLHERFGSLPMSELLQPAISCAKNGILVNNFQYLDFVLLESILRLDKNAQPIFFKEDKLISIGEKMYMPQLADFLEALISEGADLFYKGEIMALICSDNRENGGYLSQKDFTNYKVYERSPLGFKYLDKKVFTTPSPGIGGVLIQHFLSSPQIAQSASFIHNWYNKFKNQKESKPDRNEEPIVNEKRGSTTHFNILDNKGMAVSLTVSNGEGSGYFVPGTDIQLNNMLGEAALLPNGFHSWHPNSRLSSMMSPTIVLNAKNDPALILGSGGAGRIPSVIAQVIQHIFEHHKSLEDAINYPRLFLDEEHFHLEPGFESIPKLPNTKVWKEKSLFFGGVHAILKSNGTISAKGDDRRDGISYLHQD